MQYSNETKDLFAHMSQYFSIGLFVVLSFANYRLSKSVLYPPFIFCIMWLLVLSLYPLNLVEMDPIHSVTFVVISIGAFLFSAGGALALLVPRSLIKIRIVLNRHNLRSTKCRPRSNLVKHIVIAVLAIGMIIFARHTFIASALGSGDSFLARARDAEVESIKGGEHPSRLLSFVLSGSIYASVLFLLERRDLLFWLMAGIAFMGCILSTGRTGILLLVSALTCVQLLKTNNLTFSSAMKFVRWPLLVFLLLWFGLIFTNKDVSSFGTDAGGLILIFLTTYLVGPLVALDYVLLHLNEYNGLSNHTFKVFLEIFSFFHLVQYSPPPQLDTFIAVPFPTNVYTVYKFYITDFGLYGALLVIALIGLLHTLLYLKARTGSYLGIYFFALTMYPLVMVIFDDQYSLFGYYFNVLLFGLAYTFLDRIVGKLTNRRDLSAVYKERLIE